MGEQLRPWLAPQLFGSSPFRRATGTLISRGVSRVRAMVMLSLQLSEQGGLPWYPGTSPGKVSDYAAPHIPGGARWAQGWLGWR